MKDCIKRKINILKTKSFFVENYETLEIQEHQFIDSEFETLKMKLSNAAAYVSSTIQDVRIIYCKHCGEVIYKK